MSEALPSRPHLNWLRNRAKEKLRAMRADDASATLALAQLEIARAYGFPSWRDLKARVDLLRFQAALDDGDADAMARVLRDHPELARTREATWTHPSGRRLAMPALFTAACQRKDLELTRVLLDAGAEVNAPALFVDGRPDIMRLLLDRGMDPNAITFPENCTGLMYAAFVDDVENAELLLERGANPSAALANCGTRALHWLPWRGETKRAERTLAVARLLLGAGADVDARIATGLDDGPITDGGNLYLVEHGGSTALHTAAAKGMAELVRLLLERGADPNARTRSVLVEKSAGGARWRYEPRAPGLTPLHLAVGDTYPPFTPRHVDVVRALLDGGAEPDARGEAGDIGVCTPLHLACFSGADRAPAVRRLLEQGADPNAAGSRGTTPLFDAARHGAAEVAAVLLAAGAAATLFEAVALDRLDLVERAFAADPAAIARNHPYSGTTPWALARAPRVREFLLARGSRPTVHEAAELGWTEELCRQLAADPSAVAARSEKGMTPLHHAIDWGHVDAVRALLENGADPAAPWTPGPGWTPLELARRRNQPEVIRMIEARSVSG